MPFEMTHPLAVLQQQAKDRVDVLAGQIRSKYITVAPGQEATYAAKEADAKAYISANYPVDLTPYPWIKAESLATGLTAKNLADSIVYTASLWAAVGSQIEGARRQAKLAISAANTVAEIRSFEQFFVLAMGQF